MKLYTSMLSCIGIAVLCACATKPAPRSASIPAMGTNMGMTHEDSMFALRITPQELRQSRLTQAASLPAESIGQPQKTALPDTISAKHVRDSIRAVRRAERLAKRNAPKPCTATPDTIWTRRKVYNSGRTDICRSTVENGPCIRAKK